MNMGTVMRPIWQVMNIQYDGQYSGEHSAHQYIVTNPSSDHVQVGRFPEEEIKHYLVSEGQDGEYEAYYGYELVPLCG